MSLPYSGRRTIAIAQRLKSEHGFDYRKAYVIAHLNVMHDRKSTDFFDLTTGEVEDIHLLHPHSSHQHTKDW